MRTRIRWFIAVLVAFAAAPSAAHAYGPNIIQVIVNSTVDANVLDVTADQSAPLDVSLTLQEVRPAVVQIKAAAPETFVFDQTLVGNGYVKDAGQFCAGIDAQTIECSEASLSKIDVGLGAANDRLEVLGDGISVPLEAGTALSTSDPATFIGGSEDDTFIGGGGDDHLSGGSGNDKLYGGWGADTLDGGPGNDYLRGDEGRDLLDGGAGDDALETAYPFPLSDGDVAEADDPASSCGTGNDFVVANPTDTAAWIGQCARHWGPVTSSGITPGGTPTLGEVLSVSFTTTGSPLESVEVHWMRCYPTPGESVTVRCVADGTGTTHTVTADDSGATVVADADVGWYAAGFTPVYDWPSASSVDVPVLAPAPTPVSTTPNGPTATPAPIRHPAVKPTPVPTKPTAAAIAKQFVLELRGSTAKELARGTSLTLPAGAGGVTVSLWVPHHALWSTRLPASAQPQAVRVTFSAAARRALARQVRRNGRATITVRVIPVAHGAPAAEQSARTASPGR